MIYSDVSTDPSVQLMVYDSYSVFQSLTSLFKTDYLERLFHPEYWIDLDSYLFENITLATTSGLYAAIITRIPLCEPRVLVRTDLSNVFADPDNNLYKVALYFTIKGLDDEMFEYFGVLRRPTTTASS